MKERTYTRLMMTMAVVASVVGLMTMKVRAAGIEEIQIGVAPVRVEYVSTSPNECLDSVNESLERYPESLLLAFYEDNGRFVLDPTGESTHGHAGLYKQYDFDSEGNLIPYLVEDLTNGERNGKINTVPIEEQNTVNVRTDTLKHTNMGEAHELGHWMDMYLMRKGYAYNSSDGAVFYEIYEEEHAYSGFASYNNWCTAEYYAEAFSRLYQDPDSLNRIPKTKAFMVSVLEECFGGVYRVVEPEPEEVQEPVQETVSLAEAETIEHWIFRRVYLSERDVLGYYPPYYAEIRIA